tara:strand:- start:466 stop:630 length:165 start_codon:yes stop_codon:yes gene_type:complete
VKFNPLSLKNIEPKDSIAGNIGGRDLDSAEKMFFDTSIYEPVSIIEIILLYGVK